MLEKNIIAKQLIENKELRDEIKRLKETKEVCEYCGEERSMGNKPIYKDNSKDIYIYGNMLCILESDNSMALKIKINSCPMCGGEI